MKPASFLAACLLAFAVFFPGFAQSTIQFSATTYTVAEAAGAVALAVRRAGESNTAVAVDYSTIDASATHGLKYVSVLGTLMFGPGETTRIIEVPILNDGLVGSTKSFRAILTNPSGGVVLGTRTNVTVSIGDGDVGIQFLQASYAVSEDAGAVMVGVTRGDDGILPLTIELATADLTATSGVDYTGTAVTLSFAPQERFKLVPIPIRNNTLKQAGRTFRVILTSRGETALGTLKATIVRIADNDQGFQFEFASYTVAEDSGTARISVLRGTDDTDTTVTVDFATADLSATNGSDYMTFSKTISFGPRESVKLIEVPILNDGITEPSKNFRVTLSNPTGEAELGTRATATVTILDNDPGLGFELSSNSVWENAGAVTVAVLRGNDKALGPLTVNYETSNLSAEAGQDYQAASGTISFAEQETVKSITIPILQNGSTKAANFRVRLSNLVGEAMLGRATTMVNILDASGLTSRAVTPWFDTALAIRREGGINLLTWNGGGQLLKADHPTGPWQNLPSATSPTAVQSEISSAFYRVTGPRPANVLVPSSYDGKTPLPLIILLHGSGGSGAVSEAPKRFSPLAESRGFLYCLPDGTIDPGGGSFWNGTDYCCDSYRTGDFRTGVDDAGYLRALIEEIGRQFAVDRKRVHLIGHSNGGFMAYRMACESADIIASIASLAGATFLDPGQCAPSEPVGILNIHGTADSIVSYGGGGSTSAPYTPPYPGAVQTVETWAGYNDATNPSTDIESSLNLSLDVAGLDTVITRYANHPPGGSVELWTINGGSHAPTFYSGNSASEFAPRVIDWLLAHPKP